MSDTKSRQQTRELGAAIALDIMELPPQEPRELGREFVRRVLLSTGPDLERLEELHAGVQHARDIILGALAELERVAVNVARERYERERGGRHG